MQDTIFALSSGQGRSAVAVVRLSGPRAMYAARALCGRDFEPRRAHLAPVRDPNTNEKLDVALVFPFVAPASFTGEDCLEFHLHGSRAVINGVLTALGRLNGFRLAQPGEFTRRAFENGKISLESAEGLADLISADTHLQRQQALAQMRGGLSEAASRWRQNLLGLRAAIEAHLDFPEEGDVPGGILSELSDELAAFEKELKNILARSRMAEVVRDGFVIIIAGPPNSGKSSLLNHLVQREVAITSEIAGTTRDLIEVNLDLDGVPVVLVDTAGIRDTNETIEKKGIARALERAQNAQLIIWLDAVDLTPSEPPPDLVSLGVPILRFRSKADLAGTCDKVGAPAVDATAISSVTGAGVVELIAAITHQARQELGEQEHALIVRQRHFAVLKEVISGVSSAQEHLSRSAPELAAEEIRRSAACVAQLTSKTDVEDVLEIVFSRFCMGK